MIKFAWLPTLTMTGFTWLRFYKQLRHGDQTINLKFLSQARYDAGERAESTIS